LSLRGVEAKKVDVRKCVKKCVHGIQDAAEKAFDHLVNCEFMDSEGNIIVPLDKEAAAGKRGVGRTAAVLPSQQTSLVPVGQAHASNPASNLQTLLLAQQASMVGGGGAVDPGVLELLVRLRAGGDSSTPQGQAMSLGDGSEQKEKASIPKRRKKNESMLALPDKPAEQSPPSANTPVPKTGRDDSAPWRKPFGTWDEDMVTMLLQEGGGVPEAL
jgi:hypothetical protein